MDTVNSIEGIWLAVVCLALVVTVRNLIAGIIRWLDARRAAGPDPDVRAKARVIQARGNARRDAVRFGQAVCGLIAVLPSLQRPGNIELSIDIVAIILIPAGLALNSYLDLRVRDTIERLVGRRSRGAPS